MTAADSRIAAAIGALLLLSGCGGQGAEPDAAISAVEVPTQDEADAAAEQSITEQNADEVFEQLEREIEQELNEDG